MSDDLISRKAVLNILTEARVKDSILCSPAFVEILTQRIKKIPTVFDNEKVIEKLKCECDNRLKNWEENLFWNENRKEEGVIKGLSMAITIVEKGGIE